MISFFLKGITSATNLYPSIANRPFNDIDVLVLKRDLEHVKNALISAGFLAVDCFDDSCDGGAADLRFASQEDILGVEKYLDQTYPLTKLVKKPLPFGATVDVHFAFGRPSPGRRLDGEKFIRSLIARSELSRMGNTSFPGLSKEDFILFCCLHLYKEELEIYAMPYNNDGYLLRYCELYRAIKSWHNVLDWAYLRQTIDRLKINRNVYYCLYHCVEIFDEMNDFVHDFLKDIEPADKTFLDEYGGFDTHEKAIWNIPFIERLFIKYKYRIAKKKFAKIFR